MSNKKVLPLIFEPNPLLHQKSEEVAIIDEGIIDLAEKLIATMQHHKGLGLAAVQVGVLKKIIAIDMINEGREGDKPLKFSEGPMILINPKIIEQSEEKSVYQEGCLSFGSIYPEIERPNGVKVAYLGLDGEERILEIANNIMAACIQHEIDHTNGIVFVDRLSRIKKEFIMKKYLKARKDDSSLKH
jgi:peptide deformylase